MADLGAIIDALRSDDAKERRRGFAEAEAYLDSEEVDMALAPDLVDALLPALAHSNPQFVQGALGLLIALVEVMGEDLSPYVAGVWKPLVERLGDAKVANRERAVDLSVALSTLVVAASLALEKLRPGWEHKNWRARESTLLWFGRLLAQHDSPQTLGFGLKAMLPTVVKLLEDREPPVREAAFIAIEQMYRHSGEPMLGELHRANLRPTTLKPLLARISPSSSNDGATPLAVGDDDGEGSHGQPSPGSTDGPAPPSARAGSALPSNRRPPSPSASKRPSSGPPSSRGGGGGASASGWGSAEGASHAGDDDGVAPVAIYSERELSGEFERLNEQLRHPTDWAVRSSALRRMHSLILGGACEYASFTGHLRGLKEPLVAQCAELRSSLVREACAVLALVAATLREAFEPFCSDYFPPLIKQTTVTIQIIREASNDCLRAMLIYVMPVRLVPRLLSAVSDRSASLRKNGIEYLLLLLDALPAHAEGERSPLEKHADAIATQLKASLADAIAEVRASSRTTLWAFHRHFPNKVGRLLPTLDASTHKLVLVERDHYQHARADGSGPSLHGVVHGGSRGSIETKGAPAARSGSTPALRQPSALGRQSSNSSVGSTASATPAPPEAKRDAPATRDDALSSGSQLGGGFGSARRVPVGGGTASARRSASQPPPPPPDHGANGGVSARGAYAVHDERPVGGGAHNGGGYAASNGGYSHQPNSPPREKSGPPVATNGGGAPLQRSQSMARQQQRRAEAEARARAEAESHALAVADGIDGADGYAEGYESALALPAEDAASVLAKGSSKDWGTRAAGCNELGALMASAERRHELAPILDKVTTMLLEKLSDPHYKVVHAALTCTGALAGCFPHAMEASLERFLPQLLLRAHEARDSLRAAAHAALAAVQASFAPEGLVPVLLRVMDVNLPRVRAATLALIGQCAGSAPVGYMTSPVHMRQMVTKAHPHISDKNAELRRAALACLHALHESCATVFVQQLAALPLPTQSTIKTLMLQRAPNIDAEMAAAHKGQGRDRRQSAPPQQQPPPPPPPHSPPPQQQHYAPPPPPAAQHHHQHASSPPTTHQPQPAVAPPPPSSSRVAVDTEAFSSVSDSHMPQASARGVGGYSGANGCAANGTASHRPSATPLPQAQQLAPPIVAAANEISTLEPHRGIGGPGPQPDPALRPLQPSHHALANQQAGTAPGGALMGAHLAGAGGTPEDWLALMPALLRQVRALSPHI